MSNALAPHPQLAAYACDSDRKQTFLREIFTSTAADYDRLENLAALGSGRRYRREALLRAGLQSGMQVLDVATGTGLVAREALAIVGPGGGVVGVDPSAGMLREAASLAALRRVLGTGENLPLADAQFDFLSMGYALRHVTDLRQAFGEFHRVLRPGGKLCVLEITRPPSALARRTVELYFRLLLPILARVMTRSPETPRLWQYYWETIDRCVPPEVVVEALREGGFADVRRHRVFGVFSEYTATRG